MASYLDIKNQLESQLKASITSGDMKQALIVNQRIYEETFKVYQQLRRMKERCPIAVKMIEGIELVLEACCDFGQHWTYECHNQNNKEDN